MTLKEELTSLYGKSKEGKRKDYLENKLPCRMKEAAQKGYSCIILSSPEVAESGCSFYDIEKWCTENDFERRYGVSTFSGPYLTIYLF